MRLLSTDGRRIQYCAGAHGPIDAHSNLAFGPASNDFLSVTDAGFMGPRGADGSLPAVDFLKLRAASQMIDKGTNVNLPFVGAAPDLGA